MILNGTSAYEIKTELDTLDRLGGQLAAYRRVFDRTYVVTHESLLKKIERAAAPPAGVILLTDRYTLKVVREALPNADGTDPAAIFGVLRRDEYIRIIERHFGSAPDARDADFYEECRRAFAAHSPAAAHAGMVRDLGGSGGRQRACRLHPGPAALTQAVIHGT